MSKCPLGGKITWVRSTALNPGLQKTASLGCRHVLLGHSVFSENLILYPALINQEILLTSTDFQPLLKN